VQEKRMNDKFDAPRVVVTGLGVAAPGGIGVEMFWDLLTSGRSAIGPITLFDAKGFAVQIAGEVRGFDLGNFVKGNVKRHRLGRHTQLGIAAFQMGLDDAGLDEEALQKHAPLPVVVGVSTSSLDVLERDKERLMRGGPSRVSSYVVSASQPHAVASALAESLPVVTHTTTVASACTAGLEAIAVAADMIRAGRVELALAGGADSCITGVAVAGFGTAGMVPEGDVDPATVSRPFDRLRTGGILSEGAGMVVLENLDSALARGAVPLAEVIGYGATVDPVGGRPASGFVDCMRLAMADAGKEKGEIDYICAHGPSDPVLDLVETQAIKEVFNSRAYQIPVSSIKGAIGNPLSAAGPLELAACVKIMEQGCIPPTANYRYADPACDLDYVSGDCRWSHVDCALINVHGLGGTNRTLIVQRVK
jgi:3-oxoacyl-[acyl-carrier-protein] synthase II